MNLKAELSADLVLISCIKKLIFTGIFALWVNEFKISAMIFTL